MALNQSAKSVLVFDNYEVNKIVFIKRNSHTDLYGDVNFDLSTEILESEDGKSYKVVVRITLGDEDGNIQIELEIAGYFSFDSIMEDDQLMKDKLIEKNTLAILYPYVRSLLTTITSNAGITPIILPTININTFLESKESRTKRIRK